MSKQQQCIGFGEFEGSCKEPTCSQSPYWCTRCEGLRRAHLDRRLEELAHDFGVPPDVLGLKRSTHESSMHTGSSGEAPEECSQESSED